MYYSPTGKAMELMEWAKKYGETDAFHRVGEHSLPTKKHQLIWVSTVYLGIDHSFSGLGPPLIFETMVFAAPTHCSELRMERYSTIEQAVAGHWRWVRKARRWWVWWYLEALREGRK